MKLKNFFGKTLLAAIIAGGFNNGMLAQAFSGNGTSGDPYIVATAADLAKLSVETNGGNDYAGKYFKMTDDIDLSSYSSGEGWAPIGVFAGVFDGSNNKITNLTINLSPGKSLSEYGLFSVIETSGIIRNLGVASGTITSPFENLYMKTGGVAGENYGTIENCYNAVNINILGLTSDAGGIAGVNNGTIRYCYNIGNIQNEQWTGGIAGSGGRSSGWGYIEACYNRGTVTGFIVGGMVGQQYGGDIEDCYNAGTIKDAGSGQSRTGGILGTANAGTVQRCYNTGEIISTADVNSSAGGIAGRGNATISASINTGNVGNMGDLGAIIGNSAGSHVGTYRYINTLIGGAVVPENDSDSEHNKKHGDVKTAAELNDKATYTDLGWLFTDSPTPGPWVWDAAPGFPKLGMGSEPYPFPFGGTPVPPTITTTTLPVGIVGTSYNQTLTATGTTPITWTVSSGGLPDGLDLSSNGTISGMPNTAGTFKFTVKATNSIEAATQDFSITVTEITSITNEIVAKSFSIYPNPVRSGETLYITGIEGLTTVSLMDMNGKVLKNELFDNASGKIAFPVDEIPAGTYFVRIATDEESKILKVVVR